MGLKTSFFSHTTSVTRFLIMAMAVIITAILVASVSTGCTKKEEITMQETRQLAIPSELDPQGVLPNFCEENCLECVYDINNEAKKCDDIKVFIEGRPQLEKDIEEGYFRKCGTYTFQSGAEISTGHPLCAIFVLKYRTPEAAEAAFTGSFEMKDSVFDGVKVKWKQWKHNPGEPIDYMLLSNNFVIYIDGLVEPCGDIVKRIIESYSITILK